MLDAGAAMGVLDQPVLERAARLDEVAQPAAASLVGQRFGDFRLLRLIGEGGMAAVFLAEREGRDFQQQVAVKVLRRGLYGEAEQRLFQREQRALATLSHPNIAHLIDGGVTAAGVPYLVLEYVDGRPITAHAAAAALGLRERIALVVEACQAVAAAHRRLIVHRDLKPSNILVDTEGRIKLLDFGIAKLLDEPGDVQRTGTVALTPGYAAPEQFGDAPATTATDVFALGVVLHELLLGARPGDDPPTRPSTRVDESGLARSGLPMQPNGLRTALRGDLDNVMLKALEPEPSRRYPGAAALADDLQRHLDSRPVLAHPPSRWYRARKFIARHRGGAAVSVVLALGLAASLGLALWQARVAREEAERANRVRDFLVAVFDTARAGLPDDQRPTPQSLAAAAGRRMQTETGLGPRTRLELHRTLAEVWLSLSAYDDAAREIDAALATAGPMGDPGDLAELRLIRGEVATRRGQLDAAREDAEYALAHVRGDRTALRVRALSLDGFLHVQRGEFDPAIDSLRAAHRLAESTSGPGSEVALSAAFELAHGLALAIRWAEARDVLQPAVAAWREAGLPSDARFVRALGSLAVARDALGDSAEGERALREVLELKRKVFAPDHVSVASTLRDLAYLAARRGGHAEAQELMGQSRAIFVAHFGTDHDEVAKVADALGTILLNQRRFDEATTSYREAIAICERAQLTGEVCLRAHYNLGMAYYRQQKHAEARAVQESVLAERRARFGDRHAHVAVSLGALANIAVAQDRAEDAVKLATEAVDILESQGMGASRDAAQLRSGLAQALASAGRPEEALPVIDRALADWRKLVAPSNPRHLVMMAEKARILLELGDLAALEALVAEIDAAGVDPALASAATLELVARARAAVDAPPPDRAPASH
jgi:serine/threonine-protein kinase